MAVATNFWDLTDQYSENIEELDRLVVHCFDRLGLDLGFSTGTVAGLYRKFAAEQRGYVLARRPPKQLFAEMVAGSYGHFCALYFNSLKLAIGQSILGGSRDQLDEQHLSDIAYELRQHSLLPPDYNPEQ